MKNTVRFGSVLLMGAVLFCASSAFATQSVVRDEAVQEKVKSMTPEERQQAAKNAKTKYSNLSEEQQDKLKAQEKKRLNKIHETNVEQRASN